METFTLSGSLDTPYEPSVERVRRALADAGFGVLTEIDLAGTLKAKLDVEIAPRVILGVCRPQLAYQALQADPRVAALLPCTVVVTALADGRTQVEALDPGIMSGLSSEPGIAEVAADARDRLAAMLDALAQPSQTAEEADDAARA